jgi:hypothetical protein
VTVSEQAMREFAPDPPAKAMDNRLQEGRALIGREDRDRAHDEAGQNDPFTKAFP